MLDFYNLAQKAFEHPHGLEILRELHKLHEEVKNDAKPDPLQIQQAVSIAKSKGIRTPQYVKNMTKDELQDWISRNSA